ncbi:glycosyltransferase [Vibrio cyclitrophicus 1F53]|uniref:glycosyltransferase n=1 Tax=Vibrio cyclitrophicus TaxID=47951 RepID=UPI0002DCDA42|nr:glycosyltransferase [Vibrio cyclitrophicus]OEF32098.1 glycosyl transferase [Vibrio cyclitrophicus 1F53]PMH33114.1 glycosyl transferase [Vibrio cyclitrophicus]
MGNIKIAVAMSIYKSDRYEFVTKAINSILEQTLDCVLFIRVDGSISTRLKKYLEEVGEEDRIVIRFHSNNRGLALRLNQIIDEVLEFDTFEYIARMDADDISLLTRLEKQVFFLENNKDIDVVGTSVVEIDENENVLFEKSMPSSSEFLKENVIKKCPFCHPTVLFRIEIFKEGFRYKENLLNTQDYYLWVDLLAAGKKLSNLTEPLLKFRVDSNFHARRGLQKAMNDVNSRIYAFKKLNNMNFLNLLHVVLLFLLRIAPKSVKELMYSKFR